MISGCPTEPGKTSVVALAPEPIRDIVNCTGAGDTLVGATAWALTHGGQDLHTALKYGMKAAKLSVMANEAVSPDITQDALC